MGVTAIKGFLYISELKNKTLSATFNYWSQLKVRISMIKSQISDETILSNICTQNIRIDMGITGAINNDVVTKFSILIDELYDFLEKSPDQMPAYIGWTEDIDKLCKFLLDTKRYDIKDPSNRFKFNEQNGDTVEDFRIYVSENEKIMNRIIDQITDKQKKVETRVNIPFHQKIRNIYCKSVDNSSSKNPNNTDNSDTEHN